MAQSATVQETLSSLRRHIAKIEGRLAETLPEAGTSLAAGGVVLRRHADGGLITTGTPAFDAALGGGVPAAALTEIHGCETRDAGAVAGFALALAARQMQARPRGYLLWIATEDVVREAGLAYPPGLLARFGIPPGRLLLSRVDRQAQALMLAEDAARLPALAAILLELRAGQARLELTATRRLHSRSLGTGLPLFLLRQSGVAEPTAAPVRLVVAPAPATGRHTLAGPLPRSIGPPAFHVTVDKTPAVRTLSFTLEWNEDDYAFAERRAEVPVALASPSGERARAAPTPGAVVALRPPPDISPAASQPQRQGSPAHRRSG